MAIEGVDYAWDRPNLDTLWTAGKRFVCRYLAYLPNGKVLQRAEREALHRKGFGVVLNWEQAAGDMLKGYDVGVRHAQEALRQANALGAPAHIPIYFSCDVDTNATQRLSVAMYLDGCASVLGRQRVGVYGEYDVIETMVPAHAAWGWLTYAWSGGRVSSKAHIYQYRNGYMLAGADCDLNRQMQLDIGAWYPNRGDDMDAAQSKRLTNTDQALYALTQLDNTADFVDEVPGATRALPLVDLLLDLQAQVTAMHEVIGNIFHADGTPTGAQMQAAALAALQSPEGKAAIKAAFAAQVDDNPAT